MIFIRAAWTSQSSEQPCAACCRFASEVQSWFRELAEQQPVLFMETQALPILKVPAPGSLQHIAVDSRGLHSSSALPWLLERWIPDSCTAGGAVGTETAQRGAGDAQAARQEVAALIGARSSDVVPVANATTAASAVISSVPLRRGDLLLMTSLTYPAVRAMPLPPRT